MNVPSGYSALDLVGFTDKGDYSASTNYVKNDLVHYNDKIWKCLIDDTTAIEPTEGVNWTLWIQQSNSLDGLADVEITNAQDGQELSYDGVTQKWKNTSKIQTLTNQVKDMNNVYGSKNLLPLKVRIGTLNGITITRDSDDNVIANGTATGNPTRISIFNEVATNASTATYDIVCPIEECGIDFSEVYVFSRQEKSNIRYAFSLKAEDLTTLATFNLESNDGLFKEIDFSLYPTTKYIAANIAVGQNMTISNAKVTPMLCLKSVYDLDSTYEPYAKTNQQLTQDTTGLLDNTEVNGAVNMLPNTNVTQTKYGITYTVNDDGSITASGTATSANGLYQNITLPKGTYKLSGCPSGGSQNTYYIGIVSLNIYDYGDGAIFTLSQETTIEVTIARINNTTTTYSNLTFKPMITVSSYNGDYVPYAKSNKELTEDVAELNEISSLTDASQITVADSSVLEVTSAQLFKKGSSLSGFLIIHAKTALPFNSPLLTLPSGFRPSVFSQGIGLDNSVNSTNHGMFGIWTSGSVQLQLGFENFTGYIRMAINAII